VLISITSREGQKTLKRGLEHLVILLEGKHLCLAKLLLIEFLIYHLSNCSFEVIVSLVDLGVSERVEIECAALIDLASSTICTTLLANTWKQIGESHQISKNLESSEIVDICDWCAKHTLSAVIDSQWSLEEVFVKSGLAAIEFALNGFKVRNSLREARVLILHRIK